MNRRIVSAIFTSVAYAIANNASEYCELSPKHVLCGNQTFAADCGDIIVNTTNVSKEEQKQILKALNSYRNKAAGGGVTIIDGTLPPAANMRELVWDEELAAIAVAYAKRCLFQHSCSECRDVDRFRVGESLFVATSSDDWVLSVSWLQIVTQWTSAEENFLYIEDTRKMRRINKGGFNNFQWGHLTQAIWADTQYVGCGWSIFRPRLTSPMTKLAVCSFGPGGNILHRGAYQRGEPCSRCPCYTACSTTYSNLCAPLTSSARHSVLRWHPEGALSSGILFTINVILSSSRRQLLG